MNTPTRHKAISPDGLIAGLYRVARETPSAEFQEAAFRHIRAALDFASGTWGCGQMNRDRTLRPVHAHLHEGSPDALAEWQSLNRNDKVIPYGLARPGQVLHYHVPTMFPDADERDLRAYAERWDRQCFLAVAIPHRDPEFVSWLALYRPKPDQQFRANDIRLMQTIIPHLQEALIVNRALHAASSDATTGDGNERVAIADPAGRLVHASPDALALLAREWSGADDQHLPTPLAREVMARGRHQHTGRVLQLDAHQAGGLIVLRLRERQPADRLTPHRRHIARLFASGRSYKEIAHEARLSPATVRNHLQAIYTALGVHSRSELSMLVGAAQAQAT